MIYRFKKVCKGVYRGSAPRKKDIAELKNKYGINKIVSLDEPEGERISNDCKKNGIKQSKFYLDLEDESIDKVLNADLKKIFIDDGPVFIHCRAGKDRTGFVSCLIETRYLGKSCTSAINHAKSLGFGSFVDKKIIDRMIKEVCKSCKKDHKHYKQDSNDADIVGNSREYHGDNHDSYLDSGQVGSFSPHLSPTRQYPADLVYNPLDDASDNKRISPVKNKNNAVPRVGEYDNAAGLAGAGPTENYGGFLHD